MLFTLFFVAATIFFIIINRVDYGSVNESSEIAQPTPNSNANVESDSYVESHSANVQPPKNESQLNDANAKLKQEQAIYSIEALMEEEKKLFETDKLADQSVQLLYEETGTSEEEFKKRYAEVLNKLK